jgi:uncharacterized coiled-coil DUF342 family protein
MCAGLAIEKLEETKMEDREKLQHLLEHWIEHNDEHGQEFREWADRAREFGEAEVHDDILRAVEQLKNASESLGRASERLAANNS